MLAIAAFSEIKQNLKMGADLPPSVLERLRDLRKATALNHLSDEQELLDDAEASVSKMESRAEEFASLLGGQVIELGLKKRDGAAYKIKHKYNGVAQKACDLVRCRILIDADDVPLARALLGLHDSVTALKDLVARKSKTGLQILNAKVALENGHVGEIQIVTPNMYQAMQQTHTRYKEIHDLTNQFAGAAMPDEQAAKISELRVRCDDLHATGASLDRLHRFVDRAPA